MIPSMLKSPDHRIGDVWFYAEKDRVHVYYLTCPDTVAPHTIWDIGHATSTDLTHWQIEEPALIHGPEGQWNDSYATGCVVNAGDHYVMAVTSHNRAETGIARSQDLFRWTLDADNPKTRLDTRYYEPVGPGKRMFRHWRDPFILRTDERWLQLVCASALSRGKDASGTVGLAESRDLHTWKVLPPLEVEAFCEEMECPQIYERNGRYYLIFSTLPSLIHPGPASALPQGPRKTAYVMTSSHLLGPYHLAEHPYLIPSDFSVKPYACQIVSFMGRDYCLGTVWGEGLSYMSDPIPVRFDGNGIRIGTSCTL
jgi:beta-fructofuranosidase